MLGTTETPIPEMEMIANVEPPEVKGDGTSNSKLYASPKERKWWDYPSADTDSDTDSVP